MVIHTHPEVTDKFIRQMLARELWILRRAMRRSGESLKSDWVMGIRLGLDTFARRVTQEKAGQG